MHSIQAIVLSMSALASVTMAATISLYPDTYYCDGNAYLCKFAKPGVCCGDTSQRFTSAQLINDPSKALAIFVPTATKNLCGKKLGQGPGGDCLFPSQGGMGGITGAKIVNKVSKRTGKEDEGMEGECALPDHAQLADGTLIKINYDVPEEDTQSIKNLVNAGAQSDAFPQVLQKYFVEWLGMIANNSSCRWLYV